MNESQTIGGKTCQISPIASVACGYLLAHLGCEVVCVEVHQDSPCEISGGRRRIRFARGTGLCNSRQVPCSVTARLEALHSLRQLVIIQSVRCRAGGTADIYHCQAQSWWVVERSDWHMPLIILRSCDQTWSNPNRICPLSVRCHWTCHSCRNYGGRGVEVALDSYQNMQ